MVSKGKGSRSGFGRRGWLREAFTKSGLFYTCLGSWGGGMREASPQYMHGGV